MILLVKSVLYVAHKFLNWGLFFSFWNLYVLFFRELVCVLILVRRILGAETRSNIQHA